MLLTISAERSPALDEPADLGYLLHKHPARVQAFEVYGGTAHVFYPEVSKFRCTVAMMLEIDPVALVRGRSGSSDGFALGQYVNDRPYVASSLLSVAMGKVFRSALNGHCAGREELVDTALNLRITMPVVPGGPDLVRRLFAPIGWDVVADPIALDSTRPEWGDAPLSSLTLHGSMRLTDALNHLYVLLPVLDDAKHYWVGDDEVDKLIRAGSGWLATHPERDLVTHRYLAHQRGLKDAATQRLTELDDRPVEEALVDEEAVVARPLVRMRHDAVLEVVQELRPSSIADLGCGPGALLGSLLELQGVSRVIGTEVSDSS
ncbi:MAG: 3' terminal RNA ribose 2'-O-methyltransferase Hen1, partial [Kineosporiaceae bacterium]|nr:3' terminal RNA ribose 2'-O-methyltransferase Hen1 [Aeromicrobium sp.]